MPKVIGDVSLEAGIPAHGDIRLASILEHDEAGFTVAIDAVGIGQELGRDDTPDPELAIGGVLE